ncbi:MAG TPA: efflux RND transporter periplasmic adaptor subunit, partial [Longimicrobiales bacterium]|nr:efflux RND transporter periplasmic adaptor subunit [Longimicrobiales bacterium]
MDGREGGARTGGAYRWGFRRHPVGWVLVVALVLIAGWLAGRTLTPTPVMGVVMQRRDLVSTLVLAGRVRPPFRVQAGAATVGTVRRGLVREGDRVHRGQLLIALDDREARAAVAQAEAALATATAETRATVEQAGNEARQAARDLDRAETVFKAGALTRQSLEQARQRAEDARSRLDAARARTGPGANAAVAQAQAGLDAARARLDLTRVVAPADGVVLSRDVEPGDAVQPGRTLLDLALDGPTELVVFPSEDNLGQLHVGAPATASADAYPDSTFGARVTLIAPAVDPTQGTVEVRLAVDGPPGYLRPDMTVSVNIEAGRSAGAWVLPEQAVR